MSKQNPNPNPNCPVGYPNENGFRSRIVEICAEQ